MGKIIWNANFGSEDTTEDNKMYKNLVTSIRSKTMNLEDMPARAQEVLTYFGINDFSEGVPIVGILHKLGFKAYQKELKPEGLSAYIAVDPKYQDVYGSNKITCVHSLDNFGHKRFALAHELAHYLFDFNENEELKYYNTYFPGRDETKLEERRANTFAANLLMPEQEFRNRFNEFQKLQSKVDIVTALGNYFRVSATAVLRRFEELGIEGYNG